MEECDWADYRLAKEVNFSHSTVTNMFNRNNAPMLPTLEAVYRAFGITLSQLSEEQSVLFSKWSILTEAQKESILYLISTVLKLIFLGEIEVFSKMHFTRMEKFPTIFMIIFMLFYFFAFYTIILKRDLQRLFLQRFYKTICSIQEQTKTVLPEGSAISPTYWFEQLSLNYEKLCQTILNNNYANILDLLETIIYYYDSYPDDLFKNIFRQEKNIEIRNFMAEMCFYIKNQNPFISIPRKEADLMQSIANALNNKSLGVNSLKQLSQEIATKEKMLIKKDKENQRANIVSIVDIILTIFFGLLSIFPILPKY